MIAHPRHLSTKNPLPQKIQKYIPKDKTKETKVPYNTHNHKLKGTTTFKAHYPAKKGKVRDLLKTPDNLKNKDFKLRETTHKKHYKDLGKDPVAHAEVHYNRGQKHRNRKYDRIDKVMKESDKHPDYVNRGENAPNQAPRKDGKMVTNESKLPKGLKGYHNTTYKKYHNRNKNPIPDVNTEKYDNLTCNNLKGSKLPHQKEHFVGQRRQKELDHGLHNNNRDCDLDTRVPHNNPKNKNKNTEYDHRYNDISGIQKGHVLNSHNGKDVNLGTVLHQYMNSYYYKPK